MTTVIPYLMGDERGSSYVASNSFVRLISSIHISIAFDECFHLIFILFVFGDSSRINIFDVIHLYDVIVMKNKSKI